MEAYRFLCWVLFSVPIFLLLLETENSNAKLARKNRTGHKEATCGYQSCNVGKPGRLNVHIVAHTHDDVGWLKTVDQYYYGSRNDIQFAGVQYILDSVVTALNADPNRKFIYVETAFFWRWWEEQSETIQQSVRNLVNQGRLTFINGAWSMNDEATTHYSALIENFAWGLRRLNDLFGKCGRPTVGWQIDPFGHSRGHATLLSQLGFDGLFLGRVDYQDKLWRQTHRTMEMIWQSSPNLGSSADLFTGILPNGYSPPSGFCFDALCHDAPIMDNPRLEDANVDQMVQTFIQEMLNQSATYATSNLIVTMGEDFNYQNAEMWFKNLDKLIRYVNAQQTKGSKINLFYSNPACYMYALNQANVTWPVKSDDFFPYGSGEHTYWTGYFTSRPTIKQFARKASSFLNTCKQISALADLADQEDKIIVLREAVGVAQHHDAISGTEKQEVAFDYALQLDRGMKSCQEVVKKGLHKLAGIPPTFDVQYCDLLNISQCVTENSKQVTLMLWNPIARVVETYVRIPVPNGDYTVTDSKGAQISFQTNPLFQNVYSVPGRQSTSTQELIFFVSLPALNYASFAIQRVTEPVSHKTVARTRSEFDLDIIFQNEFISVTFDQDSGLIKTITDVQTHDILSVNQTFNYYTGVSGNNSMDEYQASGAYIFRPACGALPDCFVPVLGSGNYSVLQGPEVQEIRQYFAPWISQVVRVYTKARYVEFDWQVGPIPVDDGVGKEIVSVFRSDLASNQTFYTDSNGREILTRIRNFQPSYPTKLTEPLSSNYYPVNSRIFIQDKTKGLQLTLLTDRTQGGSSLKDGQLELMVHRRLLSDDGLGVGEPLNESSYGTGLVVRGKHYLLLTKIAEAARAHRLLAQELYWPPVPTFIANAKSYKIAAKRRKTTLSRASPVLPENVHLLSFEQWTNTSLVVRLEHLFEKGEDLILSQPVAVDLQLIVGEQAKIKSLTEMTIDANVPLSSITRLIWKKTTESKAYDHERPLISYNVTLDCMEIRTFLIQL